METVPGGRVGSRVAVTVSPREREASATAHPRKSKPGPRLATVAGAKAVTDWKAGAGSAAARTLSRAPERRETSEGRADQAQDLVLVLSQRAEGEEEVAAAAPAAIVCGGVGRGSVSLRRRRGETRPK